MKFLWPASLADQAMESPHGIHAFRTAIFENPSLHFHAVFRSLTGRSPHQFRKVTAPSKTVRAKTRA